MKKIFCLLLAFVVFPIMARASIEIKPSSVSVKPGETITYQMVYNGTDEEIKAVFSFEPTSFSVEKVEISSSWLDITEGIENNLSYIHLSRKLGTNPDSNILKITLKAKEKGLETSNIYFDLEDGNDRYTASVESKIVYEESSKLKSLSFNVGTLEPTFDSDKYLYTLRVPMGTASLSVSKQAFSSNAEYTSGQEGIIDIAKNKVIKIALKNGDNTSEYIINVEVEKKQLSLQKLVLSGGFLEFSPYITDYYLTVPYNISKVDIKTAVASGIKVEITGDTEELFVAMNVIKIKLSKKGYENVEYTLNILRDYEELELSNNGKLNKLIVNSKEVSFDNKNSANLFVFRKNLDNVEYEYELNDEKAQVYVQTYSKNKITKVFAFVVTAENGENTEYIVEVINLGSLYFILIIIGLIILIALVVVFIFRKKIIARFVKTKESKN